MFFLRAILFVHSNAENRDKRTVFDFDALNVDPSSCGRSFYINHKN